MIKIDEGIGAAFEPFLAAHAQEEYVKAGEAAELLLAASEHKWTVSQEGMPLLVVGVLRGSFIGRPPEVWLLLCRGFEEEAVTNTLKLWRVRRRLFDLYPRLRCRVRHELVVGHKFVRLFGFQPIHDIATHRIYEIRNGL